MAQFDNWGVGFWQAYNYAADAKARRAEYGKWVQDQNDRATADGILRQGTQSSQEIMAPVLQAERDLIELEGTFNSEVEAAREAAAGDADKFKASLAEISSAHIHGITTAKQKRVNLAGEASTKMNDVASRMIQQGGSNPYVIEAAGVIGKNGLSLVQGIYNVAARDSEVAEGLKGDLIRQAGASTMQLDKDTRLAARQEEQHGNRLEEITASRDAQLTVKGAGGGSGGTGPGAGFKPKDVAAARARVVKAAEGRLKAEEASPNDPDYAAKREGYKQVYAEELYPGMDLFPPDAENPAAPTEPATPMQQEMGMMQQKAQELESELSALDAELERTPRSGYAGRYEKIREANPKLAEGYEKQDAKREKILDAKEKYKKILEDIRKRAAKVESSATDEWIMGLDDQLDEIRNTLDLDRNG